MFRKPAFWILFVLFCALATWLSVRGFPLAFPLVTLDLKMDRQGAFDAAKDLAAKNGWGPGEHRQAAQFRLDEQVQAFVELENGGSEAFARLIEQGLYQPYVWHVRHFRPEETHETLIRFTPTGEPYGFREKIPEKDRGAALASEQARGIAEKSASVWPIDLSEFALVETSRDVRTSGRVDHAFVYERPDRALGEGRYRLRLVVSGDRLTELTHFIKIPEGFTRRYDEMRSANEAIALSASVAVAVALGIGGCIVGIFILLRQRWLLWRHALVWGLLVGFLEAGAYLGYWPLLWMRYDTAVSATNFALQLFASAMMQFLIIAGITMLIFMAAESLTRRAFPEHIQIWKLWSRPVAGSPAVLGRTVSGFLLVSAFTIYEVALHFLARRHLGWWDPSGSLMDPDVLASYVPWLAAVGISLRAGITEECLFRAVPLAGAALLGRRFGGKSYWVLGALVLQAVLFGAVHANYPAQPAYARLLELILPAVGWGLLYLRFGLLPCVVCHFAVDVLFIGMPLFVASSPSAWMHKSVMVLVTLTPLWIVVDRRVRQRRWSAIEPSVLNRSWAPAPVPDRISQPGPAVLSAGLSRKTQWILIAGGCAGIVGWLTFASFKNEAKVLEAGRVQALSAARAALAERGIDLDPNWRELSTVSANVDSSHRFVWQNGGPDAYRNALGTYLTLPCWRVRYARFEGDVAERAEEYHVWVDVEGRVFRFEHRLPEARPGVLLDEEPARQLARQALWREHDLDPARLEEVSAEPAMHPARRDWTFVFRNPDVVLGKDGEARIAVSIAGDVVVDSHMLVHAPEEWRRRDTNRATGARIARAVSTVVIVLLVVVGGVIAIVRWTRRLFVARMFLVFAGALILLNVLELTNDWAGITASFDTAQPFTLQVVMLLVGSFLSLIVGGGAIGLLVGLVHRWSPPQPGGDRMRSIAAAIGLGGMLACLGALVRMLGSDTTPFWASYQAAGAYLPWLAMTTGPAGSWISGTALLLFGLTAVHAGTRGWSRRRMPFALLIVILGFSVASGGGVESVGRWLVSGLVAGVVLLFTYAIVLRHHLALVPAVTGVVAILAILREGAFRAFPGSLGGSLLGAAVIVVLSWLWFNRLTADSRHTESNM
ncbi:MAG: CPBP family intramembrane metalloprotease [Vicinamibacteria bacterium]|nr:CPBP family intramembrane metalloprotease [Vicinamibacteria bacterium]